MKWRAPSDRTQTILLAPILVPVAIFGVPVILGLVGFSWLWDNVLLPAHDWRPWFAWRPVRLDQWPAQWAWLETVEKTRWSGESAYRALGDDRHCRDERFSRDSGRQPQAENAEGG
jgi:hypothetical protein